MSKKIFCFVLICGIFFSAAEAQMFPYWRYTTADELASSTVNDIYQDNKGYLWFATDRGVSRFDGFKFNNYLYIEGLPYARINAFAKNDEGKIIAATPYRGVELFGNNFSEFLPPSEFTANDECVASGNTFYSLKRGEYISITNRDSRVSKKILLNAIPYAILNTGNGILAATDHGLFRILPDGTVKPENFPSAQIFSISEENGNLYAGGNSIIYTRNSSGSTSQINLPFAGEITKILQSSKGDFWFSGPEKRTLYLYNKEHEIFDVSEELQIQGTEINKIFEDHEGNIWIATTGKGAICIHHFFATNFNKSDGLENEYITSLTLNDRDGLLIGTMNGIYELDNDVIIGTQNSRGIRIDEMTWTNKGISIYPGPINQKVWQGVFTIVDHSPKLETLSPDQINEVVQAMLNSKYSFDLSEKSNNTNDSLTTLAAVNDIYVEDSGRIWIATNNGLVSTKKIETDTSFLDANITCIAADQNGNIYFGSENGLAHYSRGKWKFYRQIRGKNIESITSMTVDSKNRLWIGTLTGLLMWDQKSAIQFDTKNILLSDEVNALCYDKKNNKIWAGTSSGLSGIDVSEFDSSKIFAPLPVFKNLRTEDSVYRELDLKKEITLPYNSRNFALRFSAIHFSTPEGVKFYYKYDDAEWQPATGRQIEFASIPYGRHKFLLKAIGERDLEGPQASLVVIVQTPFWATGWFKIALGVIIVFLAYITIRKRFEIVKKKQQERLELQTKIAELRHQALAASMNPHFIFNALNSIQQFINVHDTEEASEFLGKFARLIRIMLKSGGKTFITLKEELERLNYYLELEKIRFGNKLNFEIHVDENIPLENTEIPNMVIQPIVENALWHGLLPANRDGLLKITFSKINGSIHVIVDDNGLGVNESRKRKKSGHVSLGLQMIEERLALLNKLNGYTGSISIKDKSELHPAQQGTLVDIVLS